MCLLALQNGNVGCPTTYQTWHFFNNSKTNEDIATKQTHMTDTFLFISHTTNVLLFKSRCNIFIGFRIIKEMPGLVGSGTPCIMCLLALENKVQFNNMLVVLKKPNNILNSYLWFTEYHISNMKHATKLTDIAVINNFMCVFIRKLTFIFTLEILECIFNTPVHITSLFSTSRFCF